MRGVKWPIAAAALAMLCLGVGSAHADPTIVSMWAAEMKFYGRSTTSGHIRAYAPEPMKKPQIFFDGQPLDQNAIYYTQPTQLHGFPENTIPNMTTWWFYKVGMSLQGKSIMSVIVTEETSGDSSGASVPCMSISGTNVCFGTPTPTP